MTRRRQTRRRLRSQRRGREATGPPAPASAVPTQTPAPEPRYRGIAWTGLLGGVTGVLALGQSAVYVLVNTPDDVSTVWVIPMLAAAAVYLPAVWVSVRPTRRRRSVIRAVLAVTLVLMVIGAVLIDAAFFGLLLIPSVLLAHAAGLIYQARKPPAD
jgi:hypothetical protein